MATAQEKASPGVYVTDDIGLEVTDGTASRVQLGLLPAGGYGLQVNGPNLTGAISGSPPSIVTGTAGAQITDKGVQVSDGTNLRVTLGNIGSSYGLRVISSDGTTVIIDGTSDVFKILTTGTLSCAVGAGPATNVVGSGNLTGLGTFTNTPGHLSFVASGNVGTARQHIGFMYENASASYFASGTSGGPTTSGLVGAQHWGLIAVQLSSGGYAGAIVEGYNSAAAVTFYGRYYILAENAL